MEERLNAFYNLYARRLAYYPGELTDYRFVLDVYASFRPEAIVYLGEIPSAPFSMMDVDSAVLTQVNNVVGTLITVHAIREAVPTCHLLKLGTMGEYGTPAVDIPEGWFELNYRGRTERMLFPRRAGSWYHQSKVHDSHNVEMACRLWGLRATDVMQGVVYGTWTPEMETDAMLNTRFDIDEAFGTVVNRFCAQAVIDSPITPYGEGRQRRGFLSLADSVQCMVLTIENPADAGEYRVFNQFENVYELTELACLIQRVGAAMGSKSVVNHVENPRVEAERHYYNPQHQRLFELGYRPTRDIETEVRSLLMDLIPHRKLIEQYLHAQPTICWDGRRRNSQADPSLH
jgi:UDP-sulfoquinovose synthase